MMCNICILARRYERKSLLTPPAAHASFPRLTPTFRSGNFPAMAANEASRLNFARNCRDLIVEYDFDGIDIDWEYPGYADHGGTPGDAENFNLLLRDVRAALDDLGAETDKTYGLTAALPCGPSNIENVDVAAVSGYLSELNLMTYGAFMFSFVHSPPPPSPRRVAFRLIITSSELDEKRNQNE
jgi:chitinase